MVGDEAVELHGWGRTPRSAARLVPPVDEDLFPSGAARGVLPRGLGRSYGDAALNAGGTVYDMTVRDEFLDFDVRTGLVTVDAGVSLHELMRRVLPFGWFVPVTPGTRYVTVGGSIACDVHGKNHHVEGGFAAHVTSFRLHTPTRGLIDVSPHSDPDVFWATAGGMGLTGIITEATIQLMPVETPLVRVDTERAADLDDLMSRMAAGDDAYRYSVAWIDLLARGRSMGRAVLTRGDHATIEELPERKRGRPLALDAGELLSVPDLVPDGLLRPITVKAFNELWFRKAPKSRRDLQSIPAFFHPLDGVADWNRLYGQQGFLQYQFVVPVGQEETVRTIVGEMSAAQCPSFLAVLKRLGPGTGWLSFPIEGWTLALDVPVGMSGLPDLLDRADTKVVDAGGRVYLAKDARLRPETLRHMYPDLARWQEIRNELDPRGVLRSDLARRLDL
jgi:decaprenylphospho-beta-D-ribofuranose 2-oxidase